MIIPDNFLIFSAASFDEIAIPLDEMKHGIFSYYLMKGMEGHADKNEDNKISSGELNSYIQENVLKQTSGSQKPDLVGNFDKILIRSDVNLRQTILKINEGGIQFILGTDIDSKGIQDTAELLRSFAGISTIDRGSRNAGTVNNIRIRGLNLQIHFNIYTLITFSILIF